MIGQKFFWQGYEIQVHIADVCMPSSLAFVTMIKYGRHIHKDDWSITEHMLARRAVRAYEKNPPQLGQVITPQPLEADS